MTGHSSDSSLLLRRAAAGDPAACAAVFDEHRSRLKRMVRLRLHPRLLRRVDESDVVQEVFLEASRKLREYVSNPSLPFFLWLRQITAHKVIDLHRRHLGAAARDLRREAPMPAASLPCATSASLAAQLLGGLTSPSSAAIRVETQRLVQEALNSMDAIDREVLALRHFEQLTNGEAARVLEISQSACSNRYVRALARLRKILMEVRGLA